MLEFAEELRPVPATPPVVDAATTAGRADEHRIFLDEHRILLKGDLSFLAKGPPGRL